MALRMDMSLNQRMEQRLSISTQMIQSFKMLQLPLLAFEQRITAELEENPVLELDAEEAKSDEESNDEEKETEGSDEAEDQEVSGEDDGAYENMEWDGEETFSNIDEDSDWNEYFPARRARSSNDGGGKMDAIQNTAGPSGGLQDYLHEQLSFLDVDESVFGIAEEIIFHIDKDGYCKVAFDRIFEHWKHKPSDKEAEEALALVQSLDPPGIGARTLEECLLIQINRATKATPLEEALITKHFKDAAANRIPKIAKEEECTIGEVQDAIQLIASLNPKPGLLFLREAPHYIIPDIIIEEDEGEYSIRVNESTIPKLRISENYKDLQSADKRGSKAKAYLKEKLQSARWLLDAISQRRVTLYKITEQVLKFQREFFDKGLDCLKPLMMQTVADAVGIHVSTVSRALTEKYMQTPRGIFAMKYFFPAGIVNADGDEEASMVTMNRIKDLIHKEDKKSPLSDEAIVEQLKQEGVDLARRTIAKYRNAMDIPSSRQRREY